VEALFRFCAISKHAPQVSPAFDREVTGIVHGFGTGRRACFLGWPSWGPFAPEYMNPAFRAGFSVTPIPACDGSLFGIRGSWFFVIPRAAKDKSRAAEFLHRFLTEPDVHQRLLAAGNISPSESASRDLSQRNSSYASMLQSFRQSTRRPLRRMWLAEERVLADCVLSCLHKKEKPKRALEDATRELQHAS